MYLTIHYDEFREDERADMFIIWIGFERFYVPFIEVKSVNEDDKTVEVTEYWAEKSGLDAYGEG